MCPLLHSNGYQAHPQELKVQFKNATGAQLEFAELGLNYHSSGPYLQAKGEDGKVHSLGGVYIAVVPPAIHCLGVGGLTMPTASCSCTTAALGRPSLALAVVAVLPLLSAVMASLPRLGSTATVAIDPASAANGLVISSGELKAEIATTSSLGTVQIGSGLSITSAGVRSATGGGGGEDNPTAGRSDL